MANKYNRAKATQARKIQLYYAALLHGNKNAPVKVAIASIAMQVGCENSRDAVLAYIAAHAEPPALVATGSAPKTKPEPKAKRKALDLGKGFYTTWEWKEARFVALKRHGRRCQCCGWAPGMSDDNYLVVDHIKPIRTHPELALDPENHQVLCDHCNKGKSYKHTDDFRC